MSFEPFRTGLLAAWLLLAGLLPSASTRAGVLDAPAAQVQVSLITYGPGETYWERFGHDAIELADPVSGEAITFNYGEFDFNEQGFLWHFALGHMRYLMDAEPSAADQHYYRETGRSILRQPLRLEPEQVERLRRYLLWNLQPPHRRYAYNYYRHNCATQVRDALNLALGDALGESLPRLHPDLSYRQQTRRLMAAQPWLMLLVDLGLSGYADHPLDGWDEAFLPSVLAEEIGQQRLIRPTDGSAYPLVIQNEWLAPNRLPPPPTQAPGLFWPLLVAGLGLGLLLLGQRYWPPLVLIVGSAYLLLAGVAGCLLLFLWCCTDHHAAWANANLWLFNPLAFGWLWALWRHGRRALPVPTLLVWLQGLALAAAVSIHLLALLLHQPAGAVQQNQPWIAFALPCWLALWASRGGIPRRRPAKTAQS